MIDQAVTVLIVGHAGRRIGFPMQHPNTIEPGLRGDDLQHLSGAAVGAQFQPRQVTHFSHHGSGIGL